MSNIFSEVLIAPTSNIMIWGPQQMYKLEVKSVNKAHMP